MVHTPLSRLPLRHITQVFTAELWVCVQGPVRRRLQVQLTFSRHVPRSCRKTQQHTWDRNRNWKVSEELGIQVWFVYMSNVCISRQQLNVHLVWEKKNGFKDVVAGGASCMCVWGGVWDDSGCDVWKQKQDKPLWNIWHFLLTPDVYFNGWLKLTITSHLYKWPKWERETWYGGYMSLMRV